MRKGISIVLVALVIIISAAVFMVSNNNSEESIESETKEKKVNVVDEAVKTDKQDEEDDSFTFEPFTLTVVADESIETGKPFNIEGTLKNTYTGPVTLTEGSKCTEEVTFSLVPFSEYAEGQPVPECKDSTKEVKLNVFESIVTNAELNAEKDEPYIMLAYFANVPLLKKLIPNENYDFDKIDESSSVGNLFLDVMAEGNFKAGEPIYLSSTLSNKGNNFIRIKENSCKHDFEFTAKVNDEKVQLPGNYGPCEDDGRSFNLQAGDSMNGFASFVPEKVGTYSVIVGHVNDIKVELEFDVD